MILDPHRHWNVSTKDYQHLIPNMDKDMSLPYQIQTSCSHSIPCMQCRSPPSLLKLRKCEVLRHMRDFEIYILTALIRMPYVVRNVLILNMHNILFVIYLVYVSVKANGVPWGPLLSCVYTSLAELFLIYIEKVCFIINGNFSILKAIYF
jgi:hypothetical protein